MMRKGDKRKSKEWKKRWVGKEESGSKEGRNVNSKTRELMRNVKKYRSNGPLHEGRNLSKEKK